MRPSNPKSLRSGAASVGVAVFFWGKLVLPEHCPGISWGFGRFGVVFCFVFVYIFTVSVGNPRNAANKQGIQVAKLMGGC